MKRRRWRIKVLVLSLGFYFFILPSNFLIAQEYPTKPIQIMIGLAVGDTIDIGARTIAIKANKYLGQPLVVSNNPGGVGSIAAGIIAKAKPDGYSLGVVTNMTFQRTLLLTAIPYELKDFAPVMTYAMAQSGLVVREDSPWRTFKELVEYAKKNPSKIRYGTLGAWSYPHASMELVAKQEGIKWTHIPFRGSTPAMTALLGRHVEVGGVGSASYTPYVKAGEARLLATNGETRAKQFPDVPTIKELGYDIINDGIFLFIAPKGTPPAIVKKLDDAFKKAMDDEFVKIMEEMGAAVCYKNYEDTRRYLEERHQAFMKLMELLKIPKIEEKK